MTSDEIKKLFNDHLTKKALMTYSKDLHKMEGFVSGSIYVRELLWPLIEDLNKISSCNKSGYLPVPPYNKGPSSLAYWAWQEEQSRDIAWHCLQNLEEKLKDSK